MADQSSRGSGGGSGAGAGERPDEESGLIAAAATGGLGPGEERALEALLARDPSAAVELAEMRDVLAQLEPLRVPGAGWVEQPPATSAAAPAPALLRVPAPRATPARAPAHRRTALLALAACALLVVGGLGGAALRGAVDDGARPAAGAPTGPPGTLGAQEDLVVRTASSDVEATASVVAHTWGTEALLDVSGLPVGQTYQVVVVDGDGRAVVAGTFIGSELPVECVMNAAVLRQDAARVEVLDASGAAVVSSDLPPTA